MPTSERYGIAAGGPLGSMTSFFGQGETFDMQGYPLNAAQLVSVNGTSEQPIYTVPGLSPNTPAGPYFFDVLPASGVIGNINQIRLGTGGVALAANVANLTLSFFLRRAGSVIGGGAFAGWAAASNAAIGAFQQVTVPFLIANTALVAPPGTTLSSTNALLPVQPGDVITLSVVTGAAVNVPLLSGYLDIT